MRLQVIAAAVLATLSTAALAQVDTGAHNPATKSPRMHTTAAAAKGRNSFTEAQARGRIEKAGYADVGKLEKDKNGVWQGTATKDGAQVNVALDYKGDVTVH